MTTSKNSILFLLFASTLYLSCPISALACGFCGGDKAASVYSFKNKRFAEMNKARYVSVELKGADTEEDFARGVATLSRINTVYPKTFRSSFPQRAVSFVIKTGARFVDVSEALSKTLPGWSIKLVEDIK